MGEHTLREVLKRRSEETVRKILSARGQAGKKHKRTSWKSRFFSLFILFLLATVGLGTWFAFQADKVFAARSFTTPSKVYARPFEIVPGAILNRDMVLAELARLGYQRNSSLENPGSFQESDQEIRVNLRSFQFCDGAQPYLTVAIKFSGNRVAGIQQIPGNRDVLALRLDPMLIGSIFPLQGIDKIQVQREDMPQFMLRLLLAVHDPEFEKHFGFRVSDTAMERDGDTITMQLVDSVKSDAADVPLQGFRDLISTLVLETRYGKEKILDAYLNEVPLGKNGKEVIHGFGLASYFYFQKPLAELQLHEMTTLVALVGHSDEIDPRANPDKVRDRRNQLLDFAYSNDLMSRDQAGEAFKQPLNITKQSPRGASFFPAFMGALKDQLRAEFDEFELAASGLRIFSTLDTFVQRHAESMLPAELTRIEASNSMSRQLEAAIVVVDPRNGDVQAIVGGRDTRYAGFNRAISAVRQIGTLVFPAVFMGVLEQPDRFSWSTLLDDSPVEVGLPDGAVWQPVNRGNRYLGAVTMLDAFVNTRYAATVRMGLEGGVTPAVQNMRRWGFGRAPNPYPGILLGNFNMSPYEVAQVYATLANGGVRHPLNTIHAVVRADGNRLDRFGDEPVEVMDSASAYILGFGMQVSAKRGSAAGLRNIFNSRIRVAVQSGTTQSLSDSWFVGHSADRSVVVWIGRDDGQPIGLSGESGAMQVWARLMSHIATQTLNLTVPEGVEEAWVDANGDRFDPDCGQGQRLPYFIGSAPANFIACGTEKETTPTQSIFQ
ncbi:MAG: transglycosylase domain-containing protein [Gammaproteobacteria bacterium]